LDNFTRESLAIEVAWRLGGHGVVATLMKVVEDKGLPKSIRIDNGPEFTSKVLDQWAYLNSIKLDFIRPGKPTNNALRWGQFHPPLYDIIPSTVFGG
jgi:putative transposase